MNGCLSSGALGLALYVASWFALHAVAHCEPSGNPGELPSLEQLPTLAELQSACAPEVELRRRSLALEEQPGIWLAEPIAACMSSRLALLPELRRLVTLYEGRVLEGDARAALLTRQLELGRQIEARLEEALARTLEQAREAEERSARWHRRPALWWAVGVVSTVALQVVALRTVGALGGS